MTKLSVDLIIPLFNKKKHIERCIKSAINQKRKFNKIIIVNDGSTDNVEDVLKHYSRNFEFIKVIFCLFNSIIRHFNNPMVVI